MTRARSPGNGLLFIAGALLCSGCATHTGNGAALGGLLGAGAGAVMGSAVGNPGAGAAIGAGVGAVSGAAIGSGLDDIEARNRAEIAARLGRPVDARPVTIDEVISMTRAGVNEDLICNHVRVHGMAAPLSANDLIVLQQQNVSTRVVAAMQQPPAPPSVVYAAPAPVYAAPAPVFVEHVYWGHGCRPYRCHPHFAHPRPGVSWGVSVSN